MENTYPFNMLCLLSANKSIISQYRKPRMNTDERRFKFYQCLRFRISDRLNKVEFSWMGSEGTALHSVIVIVF